MRPRFQAAAACLALAAAGCDRYHVEGPEGPEPFEPPRVVSVTVEYTQVHGCWEPGHPSCNDNVVFFGNWMRPGEAFFLRPEPGRFVWRGVASGVPVNYPPRAEPHLVYVYDPYLAASPTGGVTAARLKIGGESLVRIDDPGTGREMARVYVDGNGRGHNPY
jgi:hypothetical protein